MLPHLREQLTPHADDNRAAPDPAVLAKPGLLIFLPEFDRISSPGKVFRLSSN